MDGARPRLLNDPLSEPTYVSLVHLGCARNLIDSEVMLGRLAEEGLVIAGDPAHADVAVLNTCSFIGPARDESHAAIEELLERKRAGELSSVVVAGCLVQRFQRKLERQYPEVDLFSELSDYRTLARTVRRMTEGKRFDRYLTGSLGRDRDPDQREGARLLSTPSSYAYLRISHGCDHTCSFCAIPGIRGKHRSKSLDAVREEARELIDGGVQELVLVAEDSTWWGRDIGLRLPDLVEALAELDGTHRVRVMYAYPNAFPWELTTLLREHERVVPYLDIPVQHVATPVLRAMRRAGSGDDVRATLDRLREEVPGLTLRTTVLLGFPGETEEHVGELIDFIRHYGLGRLGAFTYSPEEGTPGWDLGDPIGAAEKLRRYDAVCAARDEVLRASQAELVGSELEVLVDEAPSDVEGELAVGRTERDAPEVDLIAVVEDCGVPVGRRVRARVTALDEQSNLICEPSREVRS